MNYKDAGVDICNSNLFTDKLKFLTKNTYNKNVISGIGGFASITSIPSNYKNPLIVSSTDGVGTKLKVAAALNKHDTIGIDLVAMCVNDLLTVGAEPLSFLDYFSSSKLDINIAEKVIAGIIEGCKQAGCSLVGGETAEMPDMYSAGEYDLAGFATGIVEASEVINGSNTQVGDMVIALPSSGLHSNGFSLVRKILDKSYNEFIPLLGCTVGEELLKPTKIYVSEIMNILSYVYIHALVHITGGGLIDNPPRVIPKNLAFRFFRDTWDMPNIMALIAHRGNISEMEMYRTFNMGLGFLIVAPIDSVQPILNILKDSFVVGDIISRVNDSVEFV